MALVVETRSGSSHIPTPPPSAASAGHPSFDIFSADSSLLFSPSCSLSIDEVTSLFA